MCGRFASRVCKIRSKITKKVRLNLLFAAFFNAKLRFLVNSRRRLICFKKVHKDIRDKRDRSYIRRNLKSGTFEEFYSFNIPLFRLKTSVSFVSYVLMFLFGPKCFRGVPFRGRR